MVTGPASKADQCGALVPAGFDLPDFHPRFPAMEPAMIVSLDRVILYVQDVERLARFYGEAFGLAATERIEGEWAVLKARAGELALHRVGRPWRVEDPSDWTVESNAKLVFTVDRDLEELRAELIAKGVPMRPIKSYPPLTGPLCDGEDPEGNVFQLARAGGVKPG